MNFDFTHGVTTGNIIYDIETYPNAFTAGFKHTVTGQTWLFEISHRRNDTALFTDFMITCARIGCRWVGFNNIGFDYPTVHMIHQQRMNGVNVGHIYNKAMSIINCDFNARFSHIIYDNDMIVPQIDLYKIHHFDNQARATSLKVLEFNMRMSNIEDLPFDVGNDLTSDQIDVLIDYMWHDIDATLRFYHESKDQIRFREELSEKYDKNFMNHNDTKIGKDYFIMKLEEHSPGCCYSYDTGRRTIQQTKRDSINLGDVILPYVKFEHPEFQRIEKWFREKTITETKGAIQNLNCTIDGFQFDFGTGGIHGSIESQVVTSDEDYIIEDWDVASYYPNLAIKNKLTPEHLGETFCTIYEDVYQQRKSHAKGTAENAMLKLALNGVYGDSNSKYSPFYDPKFTMAITVNGQLSLCMLAEQLMKLSSLQMIQINTDGLTVRYPRAHKQWVHSVCKWWEQLTQLELEDVEYSRMFIRDVNNYIGEYTDGKLKRKGAYEYNVGWHQNHSALVVKKAAEAALIRGKDIRDFITRHSDVFDFFLRVKVPRASRLHWGDEIIQNTTRYFISTDGDSLRETRQPKGEIGQYKRANKITDIYFANVMETIGPNVWDERIHTKNKSTYQETVTEHNTGFTVQVCNRLPDAVVRCMNGDFDEVDSDDCHAFMNDINFEWYIKEAEKLVNPLLKSV